MPRHNTTKSRAMKHAFQRQKYGVLDVAVSPTLPSAPRDQAGLVSTPHATLRPTPDAALDEAGRPDVTEKRPPPWPLNEEEMDLPDDPPPDDWDAVHALLLERPLVLGTVRVNWAGQAVIRDDERDIEVRVDVPERLEVGGYALRRPEARKLRALLELALFLLGDDPEEGGAP